jgi:hypothetical protein
MKINRVYSTMINVGYIYAARTFGDFLYFTGALPFHSYPIKRGESHYHHECIYMSVCLL